MLSGKTSRRQNWHANPFLQGLRRSLCLRLTKLQEKACPTLRLSVQSFKKNIGTKGDSAESLFKSTPEQGV